MHILRINIFNTSDPLCTITGYKAINLISDVISQPTCLVTPNTLEGCRSFTINTNNPPREYTADYSVFASGGSQVNITLNITI